MQVYDLRRRWQVTHPRRGRGREQGKLGRIRCERSFTAVIAINARALRGEFLVRKRNVPYLSGRRRKFVHTDRQQIPAKRDLDIFDKDGAVDVGEQAVLRRQYRGLPAGLRKGGWQIPHHVSDAANLAARQGAVFGGRHDYVLGFDRACPV